MRREGFEPPKTEVARFTVWCVRPLHHLRNNKYITLNPPIFPVKPYLSVNDKCLLGQTSGRLKKGNKVVLESI